MDLVELSRRLENLIRFGTIHSVDYQAVRCRVQTGNLITQWLRWYEPRAGETSTWNPPTIGEQCVVLSPSGELAGGIVFYGVPSEVIDTPSHAPEAHVIKFADGAIVSYDHAAHHLAATGIATALIQAGESITLDSPHTHITGKLTVDDHVTTKNGLNNSGAKLISNNIVLEDHPHGGVLKGNDDTGKPKAT